MNKKQRKKNPLMKRIPRELRKDLGKYAALFLFMALMIGLVSGFLVAAGSIIRAVLRNTQWRTATSTAT